MSKFKVLLYYMTGMVSYGFYRGIQNKYNSTSIINSKTPLYVDKFMSGLLSMGYYLNVFNHPNIIYYTATRIEKKVRKIDITDDDWTF